MSRLRGQVGARGRRGFGYISPAMLMIAGSLLVAGVLIYVLSQGDEKGPGSETNRLVMYCAAGMIKPVREVVKEYEKAYGVRVDLEPAGSNLLLSKIKVNQTKTAKGHLYLAADWFYVEEARKAGLAKEAIPIGEIQPVLVVKKGNPKGIKGLDDLLREDLKVGLANPEMASVGKKTQKILEKTGHWEGIEKAVSEKGRVSMLGTVNDVASAVNLGSVDVGIVWDSLVHQFDVEVVGDKRLDAYKSNIVVSVLEPNKYATEALRFARYLTAKDKGLAVFKEHGFKVMEDGDAWVERPKISLMAGSMLKPGIDEVIKRFSKREGVEIDTVYNGCGILVSQMKSGKIPEAYFSCDVSFMTDVAHMFGASKDVSENKIVLIAPKKKSGDDRVKSIEALKRKVESGKGLKVALAHPDKSALGKLTEDRFGEERFGKPVGLSAILTEAGHKVTHFDAGHFVVNQVVTGASEVGIVYVSNAKSNPDNPKKHLDIYEIGGKKSTAIQPWAVAKGSKHQYMMGRLFEAITGRQQGRFEELGFTWIYEEAKGER